MIDWSDTYFLTFTHTPWHMYDTEDRAGDRSLFYVVKNADSCIGRCCSFITYEHSLPLTFFVAAPTVE